MARVVNDYIECDRHGLFKPTQCTPVVDKTNTTVEVNETESLNSTSPEPDTPARELSKLRGVSLMCHCAEQENGTTIGGSEVIVDVGEKKPKCEPKSAT